MSDLLAIREVNHVYRGQRIANEQQSVKILVFVNLWKASDRWFSLLENGNSVQEDADAVIWESRANSGRKRGEIERVTS